MKTVPLSIRIIHILTVIVYYLSMVACGLVILISLAIFTGILKDDLQLHVEMPVEVDFKEIGQGRFASKSIDLEIVEATGKVHFINTPWNLGRILAIPLVIIIPFIFLLIRQFYLFIRNVKKGNVFDENNFKMLRKIGFGLMGLWFIMIVYMQIFYYSMVKHFRFNNIEITSNERWFEGILVAGILTLVLSHVFMKGREIEAENELTI